MTLPVKRTAEPSVKSAPEVHAKPETLPKPLKKSPVKKVVSKSPPARIVKTVMNPGGLAPKQRPASDVIKYRHMLSALFMAGLIAILVKRVKNPTFYGVSWWKQYAGYCVVFIVLYGVTALGSDKAKVAAYFGGLTLLGLLISVNWKNPAQPVVGNSQTAATAGGS